MIENLLRAVRFDADPPHRPPTAGRWLLATAVAIAASLVADDLLVHVGTAVFPSTRGYEHFQVADYAKLTVIGVVVACAGWPVVARFCAAPRAVYGALAVAVTTVLLLPDLWIWRQGQPGTAVFVLVLMHLAIAAVTYAAVVLVAPVRARLRTAAA